MKLHWFLPTGGDSRDLVPNGDDPHRRPPTLDYLATVARAAEQLGFDGDADADRHQCEDAWLTTAALLAETERMKFLVAFRPGLRLADARRADGVDLPADVRRSAAAQRGDRRPSSHELARFGDWLDHDGRYARTGEFLDIVRGAVVGRAVRLRGRALPGEEATTRAVPDPVPHVYFGGASPAAEAGGGAPRRRVPGLGRTARHGRRARRAGAELAAAAGRTLRFGIRFHVISPRHLRRGVGRGRPAARRGGPTRPSPRRRPTSPRTQSVGQQRMAALHGGGRDRRARDRPQRVGRRRPGARRRRHRARRQPRGGGRRASPSTTALGFDEFILSGYPHLEEAYWFGEGVMPVLRRRGLLDGGPETPAAPMATFR